MDDPRSPIPPSAPPARSYPPASPGGAERSGPHISEPAPASLAPAIEAILITSDRPVPAARLAEALGLASDHSEGKASAKTDNTEDQPAPKRRHSQDAAASPGPAGAIGLITASIEYLNQEYAHTSRAFRIEEVAGGYRVMTLPELAPALAAFHRSRGSGRLSRAAVETLAIIAYRQPITRSHLEAIRGVGCGEVLRSLLDRKLITIRGRAEELGRPLLYGTTREFLDAFGLASLKDLPTTSELQGG
jgi:segregation and condensation protein B